jgi:putative hydrolase of HD superfamily
MSSPLPSDPAAVVQRQIDAYNAHDAAAFAAEHAEDVRLFDLGGDVYLAGRDALRERYALMFAHAPEIHATIEQRIVVGPIVIDEERITGTHDGRVAHAAVIYEVLDGSIRRVWVTRER